MACSKSSPRALLWALGAALTLMLLVSASSTASAFDLGGYKARAEATLAELNAKRLADSKATLARLDEMIALGIVGVREYGAHHPQYAKLMDAVVANAQAMKGMTDVELENKWGETGTGGNAGKRGKSVGAAADQAGRVLALT